MTAKDEDNLASSIAYIFEICESEPIFFKARFDDLIAVMSKA